MRTLMTGVNEGALVVSPCKDADGNTVYLLTAVLPVDGKNRSFPIARIFTYEDGDDPFVLYDPPEGAIKMRRDDGGNHSPVH